MDHRHDVWLSTNNTIFEGQAQHYINHLAQPARRAAVSFVLFLSASPVRHWRQSLHEGQAHYYTLPA